MVAGHGTALHCSNGGPPQACRLAFIDQFVCFRHRRVIGTSAKRGIFVILRAEGTMSIWKKPDFKNSISGLLGISRRAPSDSVLESGLEDIRESMLYALGDEGSKQFAATTRRIRYATDIKDLWYLRGDLMGALAQLYSESIAREKIASINAQFQGLLPGGLASRPSPLG
jgi:hypothetical protein